MQSDPPSLSHSLSASTELAYLRKHRLAAHSTLAASLLSESSPPTSRRAGGGTRTDTLSNLSLSIGGSDEEPSLDEEVDELGDTVDLASQSEMPSLSLRATDTRAASDAPPSTRTVLPLTPFSFGGNVGTSILPSRLA